MHSLSHFRSFIHLPVYACFAPICMRAATSPRIQFHSHSPRADFSAIIHHLPCNSEHSPTSNRLNKTYSPIRPQTKAYTVWEQIATLSHPVWTAPLRTRYHSSPYNTSSEPHTVPAAHASNISDNAWQRHKESVSCLAAARIYFNSALKRAWNDDGLSSHDQRSARTALNCSLTTTIVGN